LAVTDEEIMDAVGLIAREEGLFVCPEGAATLAALNHLIDDGKVDKDERVVLFNTGSGLKYTTLFEVDAPVFDVGEKIDYKSL
jgi:threonine synthase